MPSMDCKNVFCLGDLVQYVMEFAGPPCESGTRTPSWALYGDLETGVGGIWAPVGVRTIVVELTNSVTGLVDQRRAFMFFRDQTGGPAVDEDLLRSERPGWYSKALEFVPDAGRAVWAGALVPMMVEIIATLYACTITSGITQVDRGEAGEVSYARLHIGADTTGPVAACLVWQEGMMDADVTWRLPAYGYTLNNQTQHTFPEWDLMSGMVVQHVYETDGSGDPGGGGGDIDLTPVVNKLDEIRDAIEDISLSASVDHGKFNVDIRGGSGAGGGG